MKNSCNNLTASVKETESVSHPLAHGLAEKSPNSQTYLVDQTSCHQNQEVVSFEQQLGDMESALPAAAFATGLAAVMTMILSVLKHGDHVICGQSSYGGASGFLENIFNSLGISSTFVDSTHANDLGDAVCPATRLIFIETPAGPGFSITDIRECSRIATDANALLAVENSYLTPVLQNPLDFGADLSVYSTSKFIDEQSIVDGGALVVRDGQLLERIRFIRKCTGAIQSPDNASKTSIGLKTLQQRMIVQSTNAEALATWLAEQSDIENIYHPSFTDSETIRIVDCQHMGYHGPIISFTVSGGYDSAIALLQVLKLPVFLEHIGSSNTMMTHPASMSHADVSAEQRIKAGISSGMLQMSVGTENIEWLITSLRAGLDRL